MAAIAAAHPVCQRLETIPGMGPLAATPWIAAVREAAHGQHGRQGAAWVGRVPRPQAPGGKARFLGISQWGNGYLRPLLVPGARATRRGMGLKTAQRSTWVRALIERRGKHPAAVARANTHARMAWGLLRSAQPYAA